jgi:hypothetical protein
LLRTDIDLQATGLDTFFKSRYEGTAVFFAAAFFGGIGTFVVADEEVFLVFHAAKYDQKEFKV